MALPALRHRIILNFEAEAGGVIDRTRSEGNPGRGVRNRRIASPVRAESGMNGANPSRLPRLRNPPRRVCALSRGESMSAQIQLRDEDIAYLMTLLRNTSQPLTTQQLIDALRRQSGRGS